MKMKRVLSCFVLVLIAVCVSAVPAKKGLTRILTLTDGSTVSAQLVGDEHGHYWMAADGKAYQSVDGSDVFQQVDGQQVMARAKEKRMAANNRRARRMAPRRVGEVGSYTGAKKGLIILVNFANNGVFKSANDNALYQRIANEENFTYGNFKGSMYDYFYAQSEGQFQLTFDVVGPVTVSNSASYYGANDYQGNDKYPASMVIEAVKLADNEVNYADYDWDGDGEVDQVYAIYAGQTYYDVEGYIWPHEWFLSSAKWYGSGTGRQRLDNVYIDTYAVSNELESPSLLSGIGTACHEFSHCLGFPDFYDIYYSGGTGGQNWDLLDGGCYNGPRLMGEVPSPYTAYERWIAGWIDLLPLTEPCKVSDMPAINEQGTAYIIRNTGNNNEYYILENRQQTGFGKGNRGHGLMLWHIDYNQSAWTNNSVNTDKSHQRMTFLPADGQVGVLEGNNTDGYGYTITADDEAGDPYPGLKNVGEVQQLTWFRAEKNGTRTHANLIHDITESTDGKISFVYGDFIPLPTPQPAQPTDISEYSFTANWLPVEGATGYTLQVKAMTGDSAPATVLAEDFSGFSEVSANSSVGSSVVNKFTQTPGWSVQFLYGTGDAGVRIGSVAANGYLATPFLDNREGTLTVEVEASYYSTEGSSLVISVADSTQTLATQTVQLTATPATYSCTFENIPAGCRVKLATASAKKRVVLYNVNIMDMSGAGSNIVTYSGLTATSHTICPIESDTYAYRVQAVCADGTSLWSDWLDIDLAEIIDGISAPLSVGGGEAFDLAGHRLSRAPRRGMFIRDGKVYMVR